jgi:hypothetical protein
MRLRSSSLGSPLRRLSCWVSLGSLSAAVVLAVGCANGVESGVASNEFKVGSPLDQTCAPGDSVACNVPDVSGCAAGKRYCNSSGEWGACQPAQPTSETCGDGVDNDCNGAVDDCLWGGGGSGGGAGNGSGGTGGGPCQPGQIVSCDAECGSKGTTTCRPEGQPDDCVPPQEKCGNGEDDDCDGIADEDCGETYNCRDLQPHECNGDLGYGDHCAPEDNVKNCPWDWFQAWCHRRDEANGGPQKWDDTIKKWVDDHCDGTVTVSGNTFQCTDSTGKTWVCDTPLVLSFDGGPVELAAASGAFDLALAGASWGSDWPSARTPWLALDRNGNGRIDDGSELFGSGTALADGTRAEHGFIALAELDSDGDRAITPADPAYFELLLWSDENQNRISEPSELTSLAARGVTRIDVDHVRAPRCDARGNCEVERATFTHGSGLTGSVVDVHLARR